MKNIIQQLCKKGNSKLISLIKIASGVEFSNHHELFWAHRNVKFTETTPPSDLIVIVRCQSRSQNSASTIKTFVAHLFNKLHGIVQ